MRKRKEFEDQIKRQRYHIGCWMKYAAWEENLGEYIRARSVYERAIEMEYKNPAIWLKYAEMEMRSSKPKSYFLFNRPDSPSSFMIDIN